MNNKKYKGVCEISLFDSNNKLVKQTRDENMLTNAVQKIFNFPAIDLVCANNANSSTLNSVNSMYSNFKNFFGGVLLFNDTIEENANTIFPPNNVKNIGHAGSAYSGANTIRGTLNVVESEALENGYKFVWDFGTQAGNGVIKSVCLTSLDGGNIGYHNSCKDSDINRYVMYVMQTNCLPYVNSSYKLVKKIDDLNYIFIKPESSRSFAINKLTLLIKPSFSTTLSYSFDTLHTITTTGNITTNNQGLYITKDYCYSIMFNSSSSIHFVKVDYDGNVSDERDITLSMAVSGLPSSTCNYFGILGNYIILYKNQTIFYKINYLTGEVEELTNPYTSICSGTASCAWELNGRLVFSCGQYSAGNCAISYDLVNGFQAIAFPSSSTIYLYSFAPIDLDNPYVYSVDTASSSLRVTKTIISPYLATIDNLATPVTKTSSLSMKITYTITEVTEEDE